MKGKAFKRNRNLQARKEAVREQEDKRMEIKSQDIKEDQFKPFEIVIKIESLKDLTDLESEFSGFAREQNMELYKFIRNRRRQHAEMANK